MCFQLSELLLDAIHFFYLKSDKCYKAMCFILCRSELLL